MIDLPSFTDLAALADELAARGSTSLRAKMSQAWRAQSCLGDLRQAHDCAEILAEMLRRPREEATPDILTIERAMLSNAIMLYVRATSTNGDKGERGPIQLSPKKLLEDEWADHCALLDVRNQAMAHVYRARKLSDHDWHRSAFFAFDIGGGRWMPGAASNQTSFHEETFRRLVRMLPVAIREIKANFDKRMEAVTKAINKEVKPAALKKHEFDPRPVFGGEDGVRIIIRGAQIGGETAYWVNEGRKD